MNPARLRYTKGMGFKVGLIVGAGLGYVFATRIDPQTRQRIEAEVNRRVAQMRDDPRVKDVFDTVKTAASDVIDRAADETIDAVDAVDERISTE